MPSCLRTPLLTALASSLLVLAGSACHHQTSPAMPTAAHIWTHDVPLVAKVGGKIHWTFEPTGAGPGVVALDLVAAPAPFGAKIVGERGKDLRIEGEVLGAAFRYGLIAVKYRDVAACKSTAAAAAALALKNAADNGAGSGILPEAHCDDLSLPDPSDQSETLFWRLEGTPDDDPAKASAALGVLADCAADGHCVSTVSAPRRADQALEAALQKDSRILLPLDLWVSGGALPTPECNATTLAECRQRPRECVWNLGHCVERGLFP